MVRRLIIFFSALHLAIQGQDFVSRLQVLNNVYSLIMKIKPLLSPQLMAAPVIEGVRMPDDVSDVIIHRNGKFFSNSFIPGDSTVSIKLDEPPKMSAPFYKMQSNLMFHVLTLSSFSAGERPWLNSGGEVAPASVMTLL